MITLQMLLLDLVSSLPTLVGDASNAIGVTELALDLPVESRIGPGGELCVSAPRGRLATGFDLNAHGRLRFRLVLEEVA